jgi:diaminopimelate epimerase
MQRAFHKMHGAGNDFVVLDGRLDGFVPDASTIVRLADRRTGVGCDQVVLLGSVPDEQGDVSARFFNPDGGEAGACGNATRCVAWLMTGGAPGPVGVRTSAGLLPARVLVDGLVEVDMGRPGLGWRDVPLAHPADTLHLALPHDPAGCSMGNPHATFFDHPEPPAIAGPVLETDALFPERANIGFASVVSADHIRLVVWERGAGLTPACGSGACAALVNASRRGLTGRRARVEMPGGVLTIDWGDDDHVRMTGPAVLAFTGTVLL